MAKDYKVGEKYYLPVTVKDGIGTSYNYPIVLEFVDCEGRDTTDTICIANEPDLLLTAEEIATDINTERDDALAELKSRNAELEALLKEVMATRDEAIRQNDELIADRNNWKEAAQIYHDSAKVEDAAADELRKENKDLKAKAAENADTISRLSANKVALTEEVGRLRETIADRTIDVQHLTEENANLKAWYEEANKTASEAAEANDELKAKIADLRNRVGEQLAQIQDLNAEVHFLNAEKELEAKAEKTVHVVLNDGTGYNFLKCTKASFDNYADFSVLKIYRGEEYVAGFLRGDKPGNIAYWWT